MPTFAGTVATEVTNGYATVAEYKSWIAVRGLDGAVGTDTSDDAVIAILIEATSRYIDKETGKRFYYNVADETRYYTPEETYCLKIDPLYNLTSISVDYSGARSYTALVSTDYDLLPLNASLEGEPYTKIEIDTVNSTAYFPLTQKAVKLVGKFGFPEIPQDIKQACLSIAQNLNASRSGQSASGSGTGNVIVTAAGVVIRPQDVPPFAQKIINGYRSLT